MKLGKSRGDEEKKNPQSEFTMDIRCYMQRMCMCTFTSAVFGKRFSERDYTKPFGVPGPPRTLPTTSPDPQVLRDLGIWRGKSGVNFGDDKDGHVVMAFYV